MLLKKSLARMYVRARESLLLNIIMLFMNVVNK